MGRLGPGTHRRAAVERDEPAVAGQHELVSGGGVPRGGGSRGCEA